MTIMTNTPTRSLVAERPIAESSLLDSPMLDSPLLDSPALDAPATEGAESGVPNFHVGVGGRVMIASAGVTLLAAAALYIYGQFSPGV